MDFEDKASQKESGFSTKLMRETLRKKEDGTEGEVANHVEDIE